jgi:hypothetical protein
MGIQDLAKALGYATESIELQFVLDLPLPEAKLSELERWAGEKSGGYRAVTWLGLPPPEWREAHALIYRLNEWEYPPEAREPEFLRTADQHDALLQVEIARGEDRITTLVVDASGGPVALSRLSVMAPHRTWAFEYPTMVLTSHRGRRLSALAKLASVRRLGREFLRIRSLHTDVQVEDEALYAVNERFGFRVE